MPAVLAQVERPAPQNGGRLPLQPFAVDPSAGKQAAGAVVRFAGQVGEANRARWT
jgi:hypothetical protein